MFRSLIRFFSYATVLGLVWLALGLFLALDIVVQASAVSVFGLSIVAVTAGIGLLIVARQPRGAWVSALGWS